MGITKTIELSSNEFLDTGESRIIPLAYSKEYNAFEADTRRSKTAACNEALEFAARIKPEPGKRFILVSALGDYETWGDNKKADAFPYNALMGKHPKDISTEHYALVANRIPKEWGYTCFPTKLDTNGNQTGGGNTFHEHQNRFPSQFLGKPVFDRTGLMANRGDTRCGNILASFWNPKMRRVELIQEVWEVKLPHIIRAIDEGFLPGISMACDIPCDRCSVCGNLALSESQYCIHLQRSNRMRGVILPSGIAVVMYNDYPVFFDSSIVGSPAAVEGRTLLKIASIYDMGAHKGYNQATPSQVEVVRNNREYLDAGKIQALRILEEPFSEKAASELSDIPLTRLSTYLGAMGIYPTCTDLANMMFGKSAANTSYGQQAEKALINIYKSNVKLSSTVKPESLVTKLADTEDFSIEEFQKVIKTASRYMTKKSFLPPFLQTRKVNPVIDLNEPYSSLDEKTKALLLTKIFLDKDLHAKVSELLIQPAVRWELEKAGLTAIYSSSNKQNLPVYSHMSEDYLAGRLNHRLDTLYQSRG